MRTVRRQRALQCGSSLRKRLDLLKLRLKLAPCDLDVVRHLSAQPISIRQAEEATEPQIGIGRNGTTAKNDLTNALCGDTYLFRKTILSNTHWLKKLITQQLTRRNGRNEGIAVPQLSDSP